MGDATLRCRVHIDFRNNSCSTMTDSEISMKYLLYESKERLKFKNFLKLSNSCQIFGTYVKRVYSNYLTSTSTEIIRKFMVFLRTSERNSSYLTSLNFLKIRTKNLIIISNFVHPNHDVPKVITPSTK